MFLVERMEFDKEVDDFFLNSLLTLVLFLKF